MQRALLDTGSDINIISASAFRELQGILAPSEHAVCTLGGVTALIGQICLQ